MISGHRPYNIPDQRSGGNDIKRRVRIPNCGWGPAAANKHEKRKDRKAKNTMGEMISSYQAYSTPSHIPIETVPA
jgi:hypothetical protein